MTTRHHHRHHAPSRASSSSNRRRIVSRAFKMRGLSIQPSALTAILNVLTREEEQQQREGRTTSAVEDVLHPILDEIKNRMMSSSEDTSIMGGGSQLVVTKKLLSDVIADMTRDGVDVTEEAVQLLDSFVMPRLKFDSMRRTFRLLKMEERSMHGEAVHKVEMFAQRYALIQQRILRQDLFRPKLVTTATTEGRRSGGDAGGQPTHVITPVESLLGRNGVKFLLGMIVQVEEGRYYLEDHTGQVPMDMSATSVLTDGYITENCIVLVEGEMIDGILQVERMGNPIIEDRLQSLDAIGLRDSDIFNSISTLSELEKLREQELEHGGEGMFVILSDVHLDNPIVLDKLQLMFDGYQDLTPLPIFIFLGNFTSKPLSSYGRDGTKMLMGYFDDLANVINTCPRVAKEGRFVFVPGPSDPGLNGVMPRPPIPQYFTNGLRSKISHAVFVSNPCRIRYFTKEIVFCREDVVDKLKRNCLLRTREQPEDEAEEEKQCPIRHAVKTLLDQGHLCPLPLPSCPIYWQYDHALRLYPLPDALILGDRMTGQFYQNYCDCDVINPGVFMDGFNFVVYRPVGEVDHDDEEEGMGGRTKSDVEFSQIG